ncbi:MAG TPA: hypothetical protein VN700_02265 [Vicinamibacterales bacterium]|nr:hypothetical protein [Vicinamibacterales bacterium]
MRLLGAGVFSLLFCSATAAAQTPTVTLVATAGIYPAGTTQAGFTSQTADPRGPFTGQSVMFAGGGPETLPGTDSRLAYRYKLEYSQSVRITSITVEGAAWHGDDCCPQLRGPGILRLLDASGTVIASTITSVGNVFARFTVNGPSAPGTTFYLDDFTTSVVWRYRSRITVNAQPASLAITSPADGASPQSQFVALAGVGPAGASLDVLINSVSVGSVSVDAEGKWEALAYVWPFGASPTVQVRDRVTFDLSNLITIHPSGGFSGGPNTSPTLLLPLRHADIIVDSDPASAQVILYGPNYTHVALYLGGDEDGTPWLAEAVTAGEAGVGGEVRSVPLEQSLVWKARTMAGFTTRTPIANAMRDAIVEWASAITQQGLPYWSVDTDILQPLAEVTRLFRPLLHLPYVARSPLRGTFDAILAFLDARKNSTSTFICSTLVWRAYWEGTGHTLDLSTPNLMSADTGTVFGNLPAIFRDLLIEALRPVFIVPETFVRSPKLVQIF